MNALIIFPSAASRPGYIKSTLLAGLLFFQTTQSLFAQHATALTDSLPHSKSGFRKTSLFPLPIIYYTPETRWAGGLALFAAFRLAGQNDAVRPSQLQIGAAYTQRKQVLFYLPFQFFWSKERNQVNGELGYYRYTYLFYGIGNANPKTKEEAYDVNFPRLRLNLLHLVRPKHYLGFRYWFDDYRIGQTALGGQLAAGTIPGSAGGLVSGLGLLHSFDSRNDIFYPTQGFLIETEWFFNRKIFGSDFNFTRLSLDAAGYFSTGRKNIVAINLWLNTSAGAIPFQQLAFIGGPKKMRGYFEGRLRDKHLWTLQAEFRREMARRVSIVVFSAAGAVAPKLGMLFSQKNHLTYGTGIRFQISKKEKVNLRLDLASNELGEFAPYLTVKEAF